MIGVISKSSENSIIEEFFELFKTPWEFYRGNRSYDVVICSKEYDSEIKAKLVVIYGSEKTSFDCKNQIDTQFHKTSPILEYAGNHFPIYGEVLIFGTTKTALIRVKDTDEAVGIEIKSRDRKILRIGIDIFKEIHLLLTHGQPVKHAQFPTLEIYIAMFRDWILNSGIPLVEIPPVPEGYDFTVCLTHDVDFISLRSHKFDHTMVGFIYRAVLGSLIDFFKGRASWNKLKKNWKSVLMLPGVYLGIVKDYFDQFDRYIEVEKNLASTFFVIPFKNHPGRDTTGPAPKKRASRYDVTEIQTRVKKLASNGCEIGLHGIDAWQDSEKGREEFKRISSIVGNSDLGIRVHWLYFNSHSPEFLENAGFMYDSTFGYNDSVGYRAGTLQLFRPPGTKKLLELPMHIQDTALFYPRRMDLNENKALELLKNLLEDAKKHGGVLTINWHHRSLGPERLWDGFYLKWIEELKRSNAWFATARDAVNWFNKRRAIVFEECAFTGDSIKLKLNGNSSNHSPSLSLRVHLPKIIKSKPSAVSQKRKNYTDILLNGERNIEISI